MIVIEHNLEVIKTAEHIINLGPEGGDGGGHVVATGTPEEVAAVKDSYTGQYLKELLGRRTGSGVGASGSSAAKAPAKSAAKKPASGKATSGKRTPRKKAEAAE